MIRLSLVAMTASVALSGCGQKPSEPPSADPMRSAAAPLDEFCAKGGMEAAKDPRCKAAADERFRKFMKGGGGDEHGRR